MSLRFNTVIFDMDGTLLDTLDDLADATNHALVAGGYPQRSIEEVRKFVGNGVGMLIKRSLPDNADESEYEKTLAAFKEYYAVHCNDRTSVYEGVNELLDKLKADGAFVAVVSNKLPFRSLASCISRTMLIFLSGKETVCEESLNQI